MRLKLMGLLLGFAGMVFAEVNVIPRPDKVEQQPGVLVLSKDTFAKGDISPNLRAVVDGIFKGAPAGKPVAVGINFSGGEAEGYALEVGESGIRIDAENETGAFHALQTLKQLVLFADGGKIPCVKIEDKPRYGWRGVMVDEARHFFGKEKIKQLLDSMALYKLNRFHWHLTEFDGWRIEIEKYPKLTTVGGIGNSSDATAPAAFHTQDDIREIVKYAADRHIVVVPEIDMPGHASAAGRAYPEFSGGGSEKRPHFTFNPGSEKTYGFLTDVLTEVAGLFPSPWIHFGGDEVHYANKQWIDIPEVQELMKQHGLEDLKDVEHYFNRRMAGVIDGLGRTTAAWDEVVTAGLDTDKTLVFWWRHNMPDVLADAFEKEFKVVICPRIPCYFDFVQDDSHKVGRRWKGAFSTLDLMYDFPRGLDLVEEQVAGMQACVWMEKIATEERFDYMVYPRLLALAESSWSDDARKDYGNFLGRLKKHLPALEARGIRPFNPFNPTVTPEPDR
ncbi:MAG: beta-N-acetylhexosaminidase [Kiritimatiellales bacterium]|nr:beta-N-acetylhexosaminidase [Kiritimatiellales bacterium]